MASQGEGDILLLLAAAVVVAVVADGGEVDGADVLFVLRGPSEDVFSGLAVGEALGRALKERKTTSAAFA